MLLLSPPPAGAAACTIGWDGGAATTSWHDADNWDTDLVPGPADVVCIEPGSVTTVDYSVGTLSIAELSTNANGSLSITGGKLTVSGTSVIGGDLTMSGTPWMIFDGPASVGGDVVWDGPNNNSEIGGTGSLAITGELLWSGGSLTIDGPVTFNGGVFSGSAQKGTMSPMTSLSGTLTWTGGTLVFNQFGSPSLTIEAGATFDVAGDLTTYWFFNGAVTINGTLTKSAGTGTFTSGIALVNNGIVNVDSGTMSITGGSTATNAVFNVAASSVLKLASGTNTWDADTDIAGDGTLQITGSSNNTLSGGFGVALHDNTITGGTTTIADAVSFPSLTMTGGKLTLPNPGTPTVVGDLTLTGTPWISFNGPASVGGDVVWDGTNSNSVLGGTGSLAITGELLWSGGFLTVAGPVTFNGGEISGSVAKSTKSPMTSLSGTLTWSGGLLVFNQFGSPSLTIESGASLDITGDLTIAWFSNGAVTINGTLTKSTGAGTATIKPTLTIDSAATVEIVEGKIKASTVALNGTISSPFTGFTPGTCTVAPTILEWTSHAGTFATLDFPALPAELMWQARYGPAALTVSSRPVAGTSFIDEPLFPAWAEIPILELADACITQGFPDGTYRPNDPVTRAQMAVFIIRSLGIFDPVVPLDDPFGDVPKNSWYGPFVAELVDRAITTGIGGGLYGPEDNVTRAQMAVFIMRALGEFSPPTPAEDPFTDVPKDAWYAPFVQRLVDLGITTGIGGGLYGPENNVTRAEMAVFIGRTWDLTP